MTENKQFIPPPPLILSDSTDPYSESITGKNTRFQDASLRTTFRQCNRRLRKLLRKPYNLLKKVYSYIKRHFRYLSVSKLKNVVSNIEIDAVFVTIDKDIDTLKLSIESVKKFVKHPIRKFVVISRNDIFFKKFCEETGCEFIDETSILGYEKSELPSMNGREGWLYQQLLKLGYAYFSELKYYLVLDSDTVFVTNRVFLNNGKTYFDYSDGYHRPYRNAYNRLFGFDYDAKKSFICHYMLFEKAKVEEMKRLIENKHHCKWDKAIINCADYSSPSCFSEYETYGNYFLHFYGNEMVRQYWFNISVDNIAALKKQYSKYIRSVSCHAYSRVKLPSITKRDNNMVGGGGGFN